MAKKSGPRAEKSDAPLRKNEKKRLKAIEKIAAILMKKGMSRKDALSAANKATRKIDSTR